MGVSALDPAASAALFGLAGTRAASGTMLPMRIASTGTAALPSATTGATTQNVASELDLPQFAPNEPIPATVKSVQPGQATLDLGGALLTVLTIDESLQPGAKVVIRFNEAGRGTVELGDGRTTTINLGEATPRPATPTRPSPPIPAAAYTPSDPVRQQPVFTAPVVRADVLERLPTGQYQVRIDGRELPVDSPDALPVGARVVVRADVSPQGVTVRLVPDTPRLPVEVAGAVLRSAPDRPAVGVALQAVVEEVAPPSTPTAKAEATPNANAPARANEPVELPKVPAPSLPGFVRSPLTPNLPAPGELPTPIGSPVRPQVSKSPTPALAALPRLIASLVPALGEPPTAAQLEAFVKDGGLQYEAKLARVLAVPKPDEDALREVPRSDVKGSLLKAISEVGPAEAPPTLKAALDTIEAQQALNILAASTGEGVRLQFPIPDLPHWRTLDVTIRPDSSGEGGESEGRPDGYSIFLHTDLTEFGETWIDAQVTGKNLRAVLYVEHEAARQRVKQELGSLSGDLSALGFANVLLDVRASADLPSRDRARANAVLAGVPQSISLLDVKA